MRARVVIAALVGLLVVSGLTWVRGARAPTAPRGRPAPPRRPNVLVVVWDTVRADRLSLLGHDRPTTPRLEAFAADAAVFERALSPAMWTVPAHASLFTGLAVSSHGADARWIWLDERFETLAERLSAAGYDTWAWSSNPYLSPATNLLQGFATVEQSWEGAWSAEASAATRAKLLPEDASTELSPAWEAAGRPEGWPRHLTAYKDAGPVAGRALLAWLDGRPPDRPFLAYVNLLEAHHPRLPSRAARERVLAGSPGLLEAGLRTDASLFRTMSSMEGKAELAAEELEAIRGVYDATLADLDESTGAILDGLRARDLLDDTVVIVLSDHGENLGEHDLFDHRWSVHQTLLHVPLVVRYPAAVPPGRVGRTVSTRDLAPTVLSLVGLGDPGGATWFNATDDAAFAELVQPMPRLTFIREAYPDLDPDRWRRRFRVVLDGTDKLVLDSTGRAELFDLVADPGEERDRLAADPARADALRGELDAWAEGLPRYDPGQRTPGDRPRPALRPSAAMREQLELLGYAEPEPER